MHQKEKGGKERKGEDIKTNSEGASSSEWAERATSAGAVMALMDKKKKKQQAKKPRFPWGKGRVLL
jgi:hypothetical protein